MATILCIQSWGQWFRRKFHNLDLSSIVASNSRAVDLLGLILLIDIFAGIVSKVFVSFII